MEIKIEDVVEGVYWVRYTLAIEDDDLSVMDHAIKVISTPDGLMVFRHGVEGLSSLKFYTFLNKIEPCGKDDNNDKN